MRPKLLPKYLTFGQGCFTQTHTWDQSSCYSIHLIVSSVVVSHTTCVWHMFYWLTQLTCDGGVGTQTTVYSWYMDISLLSLTYQGKGSVLNCLAAWDWLGAVTFESLTIRAFYLHNTFRYPDLKAYPWLLLALHWTTWRSEVMPDGQLILHTLSKVKVKPSALTWRRGPGSFAE